MNEVDEALKQLKNKLDSHPLIKEYLALKSILENDKELSEMRSEIARLANENKIKERDSLLAIYNSHPVVNNYSETREEVVNLLKEIKNILSE